MSVNCKDKTETECQITGCGWDSADSQCKCGAGYGGTDASNCTICDGTKFKQAVGNEECKQCNVSSVEGAIGIPAGATSDGGNTICGCAAGYAGANVTDENTQVQCTKCTGENYSGAAGTAACAPCSNDNSKVGVPKNGSLDDSANGPNVKCFCSNTSEAIFSAGCIACTGEGYKIADDGACTCTEGYSQDQQTGACTKGGSATTVNCEALNTETACNGDKSCAWDATGSKCQCKDSATNKDPKACPVVGDSGSSASPLAILIICSLIISIIASIATAAVMIRRKANNARAAEAIVSDAL